MLPTMLTENPMVVLRQAVHVLLQAAHELRHMAKSGVRCVMALENVADVTVKAIMWLLASGAAHIDALPADRRENVHPATEKGRSLGFCPKTTCKFGEASPVRARAYGGEWKSPTPGTLALTIRWLQRRGGTL